MLVIALVLGAQPPAALAAARAKNVILLIADGCSSEQYTFARWFKGAPLSFDPYQVGAIRTWIADSVVADSAPAASAFATGVRTSDKFISVGPQRNTLSSLTPPPDELQYRPLATLLEGAKLLGKATGIVATSRVSHATPAAFVAHVSSRSREDDIMEQLVYQGVDVVFGGGKRHLVLKENKGRRTDGDNLFEYLTGWGYRVVETREEMLQLGAGRVFGMFAASHMDAEIDRPNRHPAQPTLEEMTRTAISLLAQDKDGFFLMVEGSQIDWACHANDPAHLASDLLAYDRAVQAALEFAEKDGRTLVMALSDHNTGGFSIGNYATSATYSRMTLEDLLVPIRRITASTALMWETIEKNRTPSAAKKAVAAGWGVDITDDEAGRVLSLAAGYKDDPYYALGEVLSSAYTVLGWATHGHSGGDVPLFAYGPGKPAGIIDAPDIGRTAARAMGLDLASLNSRLFCDASQEFGAGAVSIDTSDPANPVVKISYGAKMAELPVNKNLLRVGEKLVPLEGLVIFAEQTGRAYIPAQAVRLIRGSALPLPGIKRHRTLGP
jgi:alkaline phosphatase